MMFLSARRTWSMKRGRKAKFWGIDFSFQKWLVFTLLSLEPFASRKCWIKNFRLLSIIVKRTFKLEWQFSFGFECFQLLFSPLKKSGRRRVSQTIVFDKPRKSRNHLAKILKCLGHFPFEETLQRKPSLGALVIRKVPFRLTQNSSLPLSWPKNKNWA